MEKEQNFTCKKAGRTMNKMTILAFGAYYYDDSEKLLSRRWIRLSEANRHTAKFSKSLSCYYLLVPKMIK